MKNLLSFLGKILFALPFLMFGMFHIIKAKEMAGMIPAFLPFHSLWMILTGLGLIAAAISLIINKYVKLSMLLLALFLLVVILLIHIPAIKNPLYEPMGLLKDMALMGAALYFAGTNTSK
jgi:putative oxidoreductase